MLLHNTENLKDFYTIEGNLKENIKLLESKLKNYEDTCDRGYLSNLAMIKILQNMVIQAKDNLTSFIKESPFY